MAAIKWPLLIQRKLGILIIGAITDKGHVKLLSLSASRYLLGLASAFLVERHLPLLD